MKVTSITEYVNNLVTTCKKNRPGFHNKYFDMPHWTTTARKTEEKMVGDCNRPLGLILEWKKKMMMMIMIMYS
jgi:hypothetical protein